MSPPRRLVVQDENCNTIFFRFFSNLVLQSVFSRVRFLGVGPPIRRNYCEFRLTLCPLLGTVLAAFATNDSQTC
jgi:hypothetical protein